MRPARGISLVCAAFLVARALAAAPSGADKPDPRTWIIPEFSLSATELRSTTAGLPAEIQDKIMARPVDFMKLLREVLDEPEIYLLLVDKTHPLPASYVPPDLVRLSDFSLAVSQADLELRRSIMPEVVEMAKAAQGDGVRLLFSSTYRSYAYQRVVYDREVQMYGKEMADRESAVPGRSQHQLGTAIDFGSITDAFAGTSEARWLSAHAWEYGFSLSYPQGYEALTGYRWESWHYRYITKPGARMQREYFDDVQQYLLLFLHDERPTLLAHREQSDHP